MQGFPLPGGQPPKEGADPTPRRNGRALAAVWDRSASQGWGGLGDTWLGRAEGGAEVFYFEAPGDFPSIPRSFGPSILFGWYQVCVIKQPKCSKLIKNRLPGSKGCLDPETPMGPALGGHCRDF